jgi:hypothetical protein
MGWIKMEYPEEYTDTRIQLVSKDGKKYKKVAHYKLAYFTYEQIKHERIDLPDKLPDIRSH